MFIKSFRLGGKMCTYLSVNMYYISNFELVESFVNKEVSVITRDPNISDTFISLLLKLLYLDKGSSMDFQF